MRDSGVLGESDAERAVDAWRPGRMVVALRGGSSAAAVAGGTSGLPRGRSLLWGHGRRGDGFVVVAAEEDAVSLVAIVVRQLHEEDGRQVAAAAFRVLFARSPM